MMTPTSGAHAGRRNSDTFEDVEGRGYSDADDGVDDMDAPSASPPAVQFRHAAGGQHEGATAASASNERTVSLVQIIVATMYSNRHFAAAVGLLALLYLYSHIFGELHPDSLSFRPSILRLRDRAPARPDSRTPA